jgi:hypothetical protein
MGTSTVRVADGWFSDDQVVHARPEELRNLLDQITATNKRSDYWSTVPYDTPDNTLAKRIFLAVTITMAAPIEMEWISELPLPSVFPLERGQVNSVDSLLLRCFDTDSHDHIEIHAMELMTHMNAITASQTKFDLLKIDHALRYLNTQAAGEIKINADMLLQVIWPQPPEYPQHIDSTPALRFRILYQVEGDANAHEKWYNVDYDGNKNPTLGQSLITEIMRMCYVFGHQHLEIEQTSVRSLQELQFQNCRSVQPHYH